MTDTPCFRSPEDNFPSVKETPRHLALFPGGLISLPCSPAPQNSDGLQVFGIPFPGHFLDLVPIPALQNPATTLSAAATGNCARLSAKLGECKSWAEALWSAAWTDDSGLQASSTLRGLVRPRPGRLTASFSAPVPFVRLDETGEAWEGSPSDLPFQFCIGLKGKFLSVFSPYPA